MDAIDKGIIKKTIQAGSVFYFAGDDFFKEIPHYYVILNDDPLSDRCLILVFATTFDNNKFLEIDSSPFPKETYVDITPKQCHIFDRISIFDCNSILEGNMAMLDKKMASGRLRICGIVDGDILDRLRKGVLASPAVPEEAKKVLI